MAGLLLPGKPALGVVRYKNAFYVFAHQVALRHFMYHPEVSQSARFPAVAAAALRLHDFARVPSFEHL
jgi:hypothetical protein